MGKKDNTLAGLCQNCYLQNMMYAQGLNGTILKVLTSAASHPQHSNSACGVDGGRVLTETTGFDWRSDEAASPTT